MRQKSKLLTLEDKKIKARIQKRYKKKIDSNIAICVKIRNDQKEMLSKHPTENISALVRFALDDYFLKVGWTNS